MGHSPDAYLFYGYVLPYEFEMPDSAPDPWESKDPVSIGSFGSEGSTPYVKITTSKRWAYDYGSIPVDLAAMLAALPADADEQIRAFVAEHGLPEPGQLVDPDDEYNDKRASDIGWHLACSYG